jgi:transcriptional regulator with XRE-family HTH domain
MPKRNLFFTVFIRGIYEEMQLVTFGEWIKLKRKERGWTQSELSNISGIPQTTISGWESGKITNFCVDERLAKIAKVFSMRICELPLEPVLIEDITPKLKLHQKIPRHSEELAVSV